MALFASSKPILTYFDLYGKGEAIRMALTHGKIDFEDSRVTGESWKAFKTSGKCANGAPCRANPRPSGASSHEPAPKLLLGSPCKRR